MPIELIDVDGLVVRVHVDDLFAKLADPAAGFRLFGLSIAEIGRLRSWARARGWPRPDAPVATDRVLAARDALFAAMRKEAPQSYFDDPAWDMSGEGRASVDGSFCWNGLIRAALDAADAVRCAQDSAQNPVCSADATNAEKPKSNGASRFYADLTGGEVP